ncbi:MAG TPA: glycogen debranching protein, partial [Leeuwenhoekiella sp.]|nr:glycogen debranching protein [Leeuwenhoekiella sp.]
ELLELKDPQQILVNPQHSAHQLTAQIISEPGHKMLFVKLKQKDVTWWQPIEIEIKPRFNLLSTRVTKDSLKITIQNNQSRNLNGSIHSNSGKERVLDIEANSTADLMLPLSEFVPGTNELELWEKSGQQNTIQFTNWDIPNSNRKQQSMPNISSFFNARVDEIFQQQYLSPRPQSPSLQLPTTGVGNWCYPNVAEDIYLDDTGLRKASKSGVLEESNGILYATPSEEDALNIAFTSKWDNYPDSITIPLKGKASHAYLLMAGTTNPMQTQLVNGTVTLTYTDGTTAVLQLKNPENWWPIEQDYYTDGYAFTTGAPKPPRVIFKTGEIKRDFKGYINIHGFTNYGIDGGAGTVLDLPLNPQKTLEKLTLEAQANDVIIGLMSITLLKP